MKKILFSSLFVAALVGYFLYTQTSSNQDIKVVQETNNPSSPVTQVNNNPPSQNISTTKLIYKDGSYTGDSTDAYYGNVQVKAIIKDGKITDVQFLDYPKDRTTSQNISNMAMPILKSEAISAQNANVDIVSGATQTSEAFQQSLKSALVLAQI